jgi:hypothetical protein
MTGVCSQKGRWTFAETRDCAARDCPDLQWRPCHLSLTCKESWKSWMFVMVSCSFKAQSGPCSSHPVRRPEEPSRTFAAQSRIGYYPDIAGGTQDSGTRIVSNTVRLRLWVIYLSEVIFVHISGNGFGNPDIFTVVQTMSCPANACG